MVTHDDKERAVFLRKFDAHKLVNKYLKLGIVKRPKCCEHCGMKSAKLESHHEDYDLPLDIIWLCPKCHWRIYNGEIKLTEHDLSRIVKNKRIIMRNIAKYAIADKEDKKDRRKFNRLKGRLKKTWLPPIIVGSGNTIMAVCQSCNHAWTLRKEKPTFCPKCHRVNYWEDNKT